MQLLLHARDVVNEIEWKTCESPRLLLKHLRGRIAKTRRWDNSNCWEAMARLPKLRFLILACCGRLVSDSHSIEDERVLGFLEQQLGTPMPTGRRELARFTQTLYGKFLDGENASRTPPALCLLWNSVPKFLGKLRETIARSNARNHAGTALERTQVHETGHREEARIQSDTIRDVFGNPFRPSWKQPEPRRPKADVLRWLTAQGGVVEDLVEGIDESQRYDQIPILADALEEAGCEDLEILDHCRREKFHVRGCWVLELLKGQSV